MLTGEQEIGDRLAAVAAQVREPRFGVESVARRIRRRRACFITMAGVSMAAMAVGVVSVLFGLGTGSLPAKSAHQSPPAVWLPIRISVSGQTAVVTRSSPRPGFVVPAGRRLPITAQVTVPHGVRVQKLWLGIVTADRSAGGPAGPTGWAAVLLRATKSLTSGQRTFRLRWAASRALRPGSKVYLIAYWVAGRSQVEAIIASLVIRRN